MFSVLFIYMRFAVIGQGAMVFAVNATVAVDG
jgi:hypothetical protein